MWLFFESDNLIFLFYFTDNAIKLAEADVEKITKLNRREVEENRMSNCKDSKTEIDAVVESEIEMVDTWLTTCKAEKEKLGNHFSPLSHCPNALSSDENFYRSSNEDREFQWGWFGVQFFFHSISNGDGIIGQLPSGDEILVYPVEWARGSTRCDKRGCYS